MNNWPRLALNALGLTLSLSGSAFAQLADVDPGPYTFATGKFPMWYEDSNQLKMELCQSRAASSRVAATVPPSYMCILGAEPGVYDDTQPMVFPDNWPSEAFWFHAETDIPQVGNSGYELEVYVAGIEAAFATENPVDGDQAKLRADSPARLGANCRDLHHHPPLRGGNGQRHHAWPSRHQHHPGHRHRCSRELQRCAERATSGRSCAASTALTPR